MCMNVRVEVVCFVVGGGDQTVIGEAEEDVSVGFA